MCFVADVALLRWNIERIGPLSFRYVVYENLSKRHHLALQNNQNRKIQVWMVLEFFSMYFAEQSKCEDKYYCNE